MTQNLLVALTCRECGKEYSEGGHWRDASLCPACSARLKPVWLAEHPHAGGRPTKYQKKYCRMIIEAAREGASRTEFADSINVKAATLANWAKEHGEFADAMERAATAFEAWYTKMLRLSSLGIVEKANIQGLSWYAKNLLGWKERSENTDTVSINEMPTIVLGSPPAETTTVTLEPPAEDAD